MVRLEGLSQEEVAKKIQEGKHNKVTIKTEKVLGRSFETMPLLTLI